MDLSAVRKYATSDRVVRVAVDAMGGDHGPAETVAGALAYAAEHPAEEIILVGDEAGIHAAAGSALPANTRIVHATEVVDMEDHPAAAVRRKRDASINVCMRLVRDRAAGSLGPQLRRQRRGPPPRRARRGRGRLRRGGR